ncbi:glycosyltransferase, partial [Actinomadura adrarensis]
MDSVTGWLNDAWDAIAGATAGGDWRKFVPLGIAGLLVWSLWLYRVILSRLDKPVVNGFRTTVSVVVPSYREDPDILLRCLESWLAQEPTEVIIVVDVGDTEAHRRLAEVTDPRLSVLIYEHAGKRSALGVG